VPQRNVSALSNASYDFLCFFCCPGWYERFNKWHSGLPSVPLEDQSRKPAVLSGTILVSSCSTLTSISSPSNPLMTTSSASDCSIHGVFMVVILSSVEAHYRHHEHHPPNPSKFSGFSPFCSGGFIQAPGAGGYPDSDRGTVSTHWPAGKLSAPTRWDLPVSPCVFDNPLQTHGAGLPHRRRR